MTLLCEKVKHGDLVTRKVRQLKMLEEENQKLKPFLVDPAWTTDGPGTPSEKD